MCVKEMNVSKYKYIYIQNNTITTKQFSTNQNLININIP